MRSLFLVIFLWMGVCGTAWAQLQESFSDGDFTQNPAWQGETSFFQVNAARQLQSNGPAVTGSTIHLSTANQLALGVQWEYYVQLALATSSGNYAEVHLISDMADLEGEGRGYFVRMGGTEDEVSLYRKDGGTATKIINGPDKSIDAADNRFWVRVTRTADNAWTLELDVTGTRQNYVLQGQITDSRYTSSVFAGVVFRYSQANAQRFFFDDFTIKDIGPPAISRVSVLNSREVEITFSEPVQEQQARTLANYRLNNQHAPVAVDWNSSQPQRIKLTYDIDFETGANHLLISRLVDADGNVAQNLTATFNFTPRAASGDVRITEVYADVNPLQDLPAAEFFELYNTSSKTLNLQGWTYRDATTSTGVFPAFLLKPNQYVIVCAAADTSLYKPYGQVVGLKTFPSLNDAGDDLHVYDDTGQLIDMVRFSSAWHASTAKREGGWSLELMDFTSSCKGGALWKSSENPRGGTPGQANSIQQTDQTPPAVMQATALGADRVVVRFSEPLDSAFSANANFFTFTQNLPVQQVTVRNPDFTEVELRLATPLRENERYTLTVKGVRDCAGNALATPQTMDVILPGAAAAEDVVINEILFNPRTGGVDFVELVNRSGKFLNLQNWKLANKESNAVANARILSPQALLLPPGGFLVLTTNPDLLFAHYPNGKRETFWAMASLPSFPDAAGTVVLLLPDNTVVDEVAYREEQHFKLLKNVEGISLERISVAGPSVESNFYSAASQVGATPGYANSQAREGQSGPAKLTLQPETFTPDHDGQEDVLLLQFNLPQSGFVGTVSIFDANGRLIRRLASNALLGTDTVLQWDGLTEAGAKAAIGYYLVLVELFDLQGRKEVLKKTAVVGGRF
ncbi:lamin tail domain-containing protein [Rufibacter sp. LB8]|uniref:lamin tail domain-containing protein n=1 Tax=Rufibacter sp. LB8 TaxID=2777781 RepID=UPI00178C4670|nr:lamin tail domain-containing protein [Rufibacter sp. LB8]